MSKRALHILTTTALVSAISLTALAGNSFAQKADSNKDGVIQLAEFTALGEQKFRELDTDANGLVTKAERKALRAQKREARTQAKFDIADSNADGFLSKAELTTARAHHRQSLLDKRDINGDGQLNKEDRLLRRKLRKERRQRKGERPNIDANGDGVIDLAEHQTAIIARFECLDTNGDGVLDADELLRRQTQIQHRMRW